LNTLSYFEHEQTRMGATKLESFSNVIYLVRFKNTNMQRNYDNMYT